MSLFKSCIFAYYVIFILLIFFVSFPFSHMISILHIHKSETGTELLIWFNIAG